MTRRILIVDDSSVSRRILETILAKDYYTTDSAENGKDALDKCTANKGIYDLVLSDVNMPVMDGIELCHQLKHHAATLHIPVVLVTTSDRIEDRRKGLEAGADDFLNKPVDEMELLARVNSLIRLKTTTDELRLRTLAYQSIREKDPASLTLADFIPRSRILLVVNESEVQPFLDILKDQQTVDYESNPEKALERAASGDYEVFIVSLHLKNFDGLRLCSEMISLEKTRHAAFLVYGDKTDKDRIIRALDIGVHDYISNPLDPSEVSARLHTQIRRKRFSDRLREVMNDSMKMALVDPLTGLYNRHYMELQLSTLFKDAESGAAHLSCILLDIDRFKSINDTYGHDAGDSVLKQLAVRTQMRVRPTDIVARYGGEEFIILMPSTPFPEARTVAERLRESIEIEPFSIHNGKDSIRVTASLGIASYNTIDKTPELLIKRADSALYEAKESGRNRVVAANPQETKPQ
jgi:two-component system cell cycle response regulator